MGCQIISNLGDGLTKDTIEKVQFIKYTNEYVKLFYELAFRDNVTDEFIEYYFGSMVNLIYYGLE